MCSGEKKKNTRLREQNLKIINMKYLFNVACIYMVKKGKKINKS